MGGRVARFNADGLAGGLGGIFGFVDAVSERRL